MPQAKAVAKKYKLAATLYDFLLPRYTEQTLGAALKNISIASNQKILDIGCGTGALEEKLLEKFPQMEITALDVSPEMLKRARKKFSDPQFVPNRIQWLEGDFLNLQLPRQFFDTAFALSNFHYFPNPAEVLHKCLEVLKPAGRLVIVDWDRATLRGKIYNWAMPKWDRSFQRAYTEPEITHLLTQSGFSVERVFRFKTCFFWTMMALTAKKP